MRAEDNARSQYYDDLSWLPLTSFLLSSDLKSVLCLGHSMLVQTGENSEKIAKADVPYDSLIASELV